MRAVFGREDGVAGIGAGDGIARQINALATSLSEEVFSSRLTGYGSSLKRLDERIAGLEQLMVMKEKTLKAQWQAMERAVTALQGQGAQLLARLGSLAE